MFFLVASSLCCEREIRKRERDRQKERKRKREREKKITVTAGPFRGIISRLHLQACLRWRMNIALHVPTGVQEVQVETVFDVQAEVFQHDSSLPLYPHSELRSTTCHVVSQANFES